MWDGLLSCAVTCDVVVACAGDRAQKRTRTKPASASISRCCIRGPSAPSLSPCTIETSLPSTTAQASATPRLGLTTKSGSRRKRGSQMSFETARVEENSPGRMNRHKMCPDRVFAHRVCVLNMSSTTKKIKKACHSLSPTLPRQERFFPNPEDRASVAVPPTYPLFSFSRQITTANGANRAR